ncbi:MAG: tyrosine-protein phosphatase [Abditibacteriota bacterium]|nr:tyrosine-protein phosphatase [Abditibacteriota bacterium]
MIQQQSIGLEKVNNARELGGYRIGNQRIRRGLLLRSGRLSGASDQDVQTLSEKYRLGAVADFRMTVEQEESPDRPVPGAVHYALPVMEFVEEGLSPDMAAFMDDRTDRVVWIQNAVDFGFLNDRFYIDFLRPELGRAGYRKFFQILLELPEDRAILWHCTDGKDRTGVAAMLLLSALGADRDLIMRDYLLTNTFNAEKLQAGREKLSGISLSQERRDIYLFTTAGGVFARFLENAMEDLESAYGSMEGYLSAELGIGPAERGILRRKYLE